MNVSELRMGNYVDIINRNYEIHLPYGFVKQVGAIDFFQVQLYEVGSMALQYTHQVVDIKDLSPIPLTEQWFLKFGFKKKGSHYYEIPDNDINKIIEVGIDRSNLGVKYYIVTKRLVEPRTAIGKPFQYVHQLQNKFFDLNGHELEFN